MNSQDFIKKDIITVDNKVYSCVHISFGKTSLTKYCKVYTCDLKLRKECTAKIIECAKKNKLEYSEFYVVFISNINTLNKGLGDKISISFLEKIDSERMKNNLSTKLIKYKYDFKNDHYDYLIDQPRNEIVKVKDVIKNIKIQQICNQ